MSHFTAPLYEGGGEESPVCMLTYSPSTCSLRLFPFLLACLLDSQATKRKEHGRRPERPESLEVM